MSSAVVFRALRRHGLTLLLAMVGAVGASLIWAHASPATTDVCFVCQHWEDVHREETEWQDLERENHYWHTIETTHDLEFEFVGAGAAEVHGGAEEESWCVSTWIFGSCELRIPIGASIVVTPDPPAGTTFTGWGGACSGTGACELTMSEDRKVVLNFLDQGPPSVPAINTPGKGEVVQQPPGSGVLVTFTDNGDYYTRQFLCRLDTSDYRPCTSPWTTRSLKPGPHTVRIRARDAAGNTSTPTTRRFTVVE